MRGSFTESILPLVITENVKGKGNKHWENRASVIETFLIPGPVLTVYKTGYKS